MTCTFTYETTDGEELSVDFIFLRGRKGMWSIESEIPYDPEPDDIEITSITTSDGSDAKLSDIEMIRLEEKAIEWGRETYLERF